MEWGMSGRGVPSAASSQDGPALSLGGLSPETYMWKMNMQQMKPGELYRWNMMRQAQDYAKQNPWFGQAMNQQQGQALLQALMGAMMGGGGAGPMGQR